MQHPNLHPSFQLVFVATAFGALLGCSNDPVNIGDGERELDKTELASYAATWDGYVEAFTFRSGSDRVRLSLDETGNGWLQVGEGAPLPPPTDPNVGYPPAVGGISTSDVDFLDGTLYDGIRYPLGNVRIESERIRFGIESRAAFSAFCELQTPVEIFNEPGSYGCIPTHGYSTTNDGSCEVFVEPSGEFQSIDCGKVYICEWGCVCDATSCTHQPGRDVPLDAALDDSGDELTGTIILPNENAPNRTIRLQRQ